MKASLFKHGPSCLEVVVMIDTHNQSVKTSEYVHPWFTYMMRKTNPDLESVRYQLCQRNMVVLAQLLQVPTNGKSQRDVYMCSKDVIFPFLEKCSHKSGYLGAWDSFKPLRTTTNLKWLDFNSFGLSSKGQRAVSKPKSKNTS